MDASQYRNVAGVCAALGFVTWFVLRSGDAMEAVLWRDVLWGVAVAAGAYAAGLRRGTHPASGDADE